MPNSIDPQYIILFQIAFVAVFFTFAVVFGRKQQKLFTEILQRQAQKRGGRVETKQFFMYPEFILVYEGIPVRVSMHAGSKKRPAYTRLECLLVTKHILDIRVFRENIFTQIANKLGWSDFNMNDPAFDQAFFVQAKEEMAVRNILSFDVKQSLLAMKELYPNLTINGSQFSFSVPRLLKEDKDFDRLIDTGLLILKNIDKMKDRV